MLKRKPILPQDQDLTRVTVFCYYFVQRNFKAVYKHIYDLLQHKETTLPIIIDAFLATLVEAFIHKQAITRRSLYEHAKNQFIRHGLKVTSKDCYTDILKDYCLSETIAVSELIPFKRDHVEQCAVYWLAASGEYTTRNLEASGAPVMSTMATLSIIFSGVAQLIETSVETKKKIILI
jgi:hypothetical protein